MTDAFGDGRLLLVRRAEREQECGVEAAGGFFFG